MSQNVTRPRTASCQYCSTAMLLCCSVGGTINSAFTDCSRRKQPEAHPRTDTLALRYVNIGCHYYTVLQSGWLFAFVTSYFTTVTNFTGMIVLCCLWKAKHVLRNALLVISTSSSPSQRTVTSSRSAFLFVNNIRLSMPRPEFITVMHNHQESAAISELLESVLKAERLRVRLKRCLDG